MSTDSRFINPYTDFGFKKLFGEEANKDLLVDFLNQLLPKEHTIAELNFRNVEHQNDLSSGRKAIFDLHCISAKGERFIVEMQKAKLKYFKDRALFYTTFPVREQAQRGDWDFRLDPIYFIAILDFFYDESEELAKVKRQVQLKDQDCEVFYEKLHYVFLQMPAFKKEKEELVSHYDKWLYFLKNLGTLEDIPEILQEPIFEKAFQIAEISNFSRREYDAYQESLLAYRDMLNAMKTKFEEGLEKGLLVIKSLSQGKTLDEIEKITGLTKEQITEIQRKFNEG